ncbi:MAG: type VI secretion system tube protein Hcp [Solirubrobacteraceae bacterium]
MRTGNLLKQWWKAVLLVAVGAVGGGAAFAVASVPDGSGAIHACVNVSTQGGSLEPYTNQGANVTVIDPDAGQHCLADDGTITNQTTLSWDVTGPQGPQGAPGTAGRQGATGSAGSGVTSTFLVTPPPITSRSKPVGQAAVGGLNFSVLDYSQGSASTPATAAGGGKVTVHDITITKQVDKASPSLFQACATGKHFPKVTLSLRKASGSRSFLHVTMQDVVISSLQNESAADKASTPTESVTFNYGSIKWTYTQQKRAG